MEKKAGTGFVPGRSSQLGKSKKYQCNAISTLKIKMLYKAKMIKRILDLKRFGSKFTSQIYTSIFIWPQPGFQDKPLARTCKESNWWKIPTKDEIGKKGIQL